jgi:hypothetical protein
MKSRRMRMVGHIAHMLKGRDVYRVLLARGLREGDQSASLGIYGRIL